MKENILKLCRRNFVVKGFCIMLAAVLILSGLTPTAFAAEQTYGADNLNNNSGELKIAFIGGSITSGTDNATRYSTQLVNRYFKEKYPNKTVTEINAGVPGTGSDLGLFRLEKDVMRHNPDVVFVEFAVNDTPVVKKGDGDWVKQRMEGIVRQLSKLPKQPVVIFLFCAKNDLKSELYADVDKAIDVHKQVADYYGIGSINLNDYIRKLDESNEIIWYGRGNESEWHTADGVHPNAKGNTLYADYIMEQFNKDYDKYFKKTENKALPFSGYEFGTPRTIVHSDANAVYSDGWVKGNRLSHRFGDGVSETTKAGETLTFKFKGNTIGLYGVCGNDCASAEYVIDEGTSKEIKGTMGHYAGHSHMAMSFFLMRGLEFGDHTIKLTTNKPTSNGGTTQNLFSFGYFLVDDTKAELNMPEYEKIDLSQNKTSYIFNSDVQETGKLIVTGTTEDGKTEELDSGVLFSSSDEKVVTVSATGEITAVGLGTAVITASYKQRQAKLMVSVASGDTSPGKITQRMDGKLLLRGALSGDAVVSLEVVKPGYTAGGLNALTNKNIKDNLLFVGNYKLSAGDYELVITMPKNTAEGEYIARINSSIFDRAHDITFTYSDIEKVKKIFEQFVSPETDEAEGVALISDKDNFTRLGLNDLWWDLSADGRKTVAENTYAKRGEMKDFSDMQNIFSELCASEAISNPTKDINVINIIAEYADELGIDKSGKYADYVAMADKASVAEKLEGKELTDEEKRIDAFCEAVVLVQIENAVGAFDIHNAIERNKSYFPAGSLSGYLKKSDTSAIDGEIAERTFDSIDELAGFIKSRTSGSGTTQGSRPGGSGSSGGSGGGFGGGSDTSQMQFVGDEQISAVYFSDIDSVEWAREAIEYLAAKGIVNGKADKVFDPNSPVTREEFVKMLSLAFELPNADIELPFDDTDRSMWYWQYIVNAYASGLVKGVDENSFGTGSNIIRQDMAVMVHRFMNSCGVALPSDATAEFSDKGVIGDYAREAVASLRACGVVMGMTDGSFAPLETCTRAQAAKIIYSALKYAGMIVY